MTSSPDSPDPPDSSFPIRSHQTSHENIVATPAKSNAPVPCRGSPDAEQEELARKELDPQRLPDRTNPIPLPAASPSGRPTLSRILDIVADFYKLPHSDLVSRRRTRRIVRPRQIAMTLARELTTNSSSRIGHRLGGRRHATVLYAIRKITALAEVDQQIASDLAELRSRLSAPIDDNFPMEERPRLEPEHMNREIHQA